MLGNLAPPWPPAYRIKRSARARRVTLRIAPYKGLELTLPLKFDARKLGDILEEKKSWIEKHLSLMVPSTKPDHKLPEQLSLMAKGEVWQIHSVAASGRLRLIERPNQELILLGNGGDRSRAFILLKAWCKNEAKKFLLPLLFQISQAIELPYKEATIRAQQSRWGSCSLEKRIYLNYKLLFLPLPLVRHILLHELCHTIHLNHSAKFWTLLAHYDPETLVHRQRIRQHRQDIPWWIEASEEMLKEALEESAVAE